MLYQCVQNILRLPIHCNGQTLFPYLRFETEHEMQPIRNHRICVKKLYFYFCAFSIQDFCERVFFYFFAIDISSHFYRLPKCFLFNCVSQQLLRNYPHFGGKYIFHNPGEIDQEEKNSGNRGDSQKRFLEILWYAFRLHTTQPTQQAILEVEFTFQFLIEF